MPLTKVSFSMIDGICANVRDYGAKGDGSDDTQAFNDALDAADSVYVPPGIYGISQLILQNVLGKTLFGTSNGGSIIRGISAGTSIIRFGGAAPGTNRANVCNLKDILIEATTAYTYAIECQYLTDGNFTNILITGPNITTGLYLDNSWDNNFYGVYITGCPNGLVCGTNSPNNNNFFGGRFAGTETGNGIAISGAGNSFYGVDISSYIVGIKPFFGVYGLTISGCYFEGNENDVLLGSSGGVWGVSITGNVFAVGTGANYGVVCNSANPSFGVVISGNVFRYKIIGIKLDAAGIDWDTTTNSFNGCITDLNGSGTLNMYESGSWTPNIVLGSGSATVSTAIGKYTKIKSLVCVQAEINLSGVSSPGGSLEIYGLPFKNGNSYVAASLIVNNCGVYPVSAYVNASGTQLVLWKTVAGALTNVGNELTATSTIFISATYDTL